MKFFYADSLDLVDPQFDFEREKSRNPKRIPQRDDVYAHELMAPARPYDGILVSKALFRAGGGSVATGKYSQAQRKRFEREGAPKFLRFPKNGRQDPEQHPVMGDCGAFAYRNEHEPPYTIDELVDFYEDGRFSLGISLDHMVLDYDKALDHPHGAQGALPFATDDHQTRQQEANRRRDLSLSNAAEFIERCRSWKVGFEPLGAAHGWSPASYRDSVKRLVAMGYDYIAVGGLVPRKNPDIAEILSAINDETRGKVRLHLLGVVRPPLYGLMRQCGVASFDSSSPVWKAFKDARHNYYAEPEAFTAVRIPQSDQGVPMRRIREGVIDQAEAIAAERHALEMFRAYGRKDASLAATLDALRAYDVLLGTGRKTATPWARIEQTLADRPWDKCACPICSDLGIDVVLFRGANRNRRRGFHNLWRTQHHLETWRQEVTS